MKKTTKISNTAKSAAQKNDTENLTTDLKPIHSKSKSKSVSTKTKKNLTSGASKARAVKTLASEEKPSPKPAKKTTKATAITPTTAEPKHNKEILLMVEVLANEKNLEKTVIFKAIEKALAALAMHDFTENEVDIEVRIDQNSGHYESFRRWTVVADSAAPLEFPNKQIFLTKAQAVNTDLALGDVIEELIPSVPFGRIGAQHAKHIIIRELRIAEREEIARQYTAKLGTLLAGTAKKVSREQIILDMGNNLEASINKENLLPHEEIRIGDRVRGILVGVTAEPKGPQLIMSRTDKAMVVELFKIEVPEIGEDVIEIKAAARDPGSRAKIAVKTNDGRIDPIGACIGIRGSRVQTVSNELGGERIDIILWDDSPAQLVVNAMSPAEILSIVVDENRKSMDVGVKTEQLALAIGRNGQNVRLASELAGWKLNVLTEKDIETKGKAANKDNVTLFTSLLGVDEELAEILVQEGFRSLEDVAHVPEQEMLAIEGFDKDLVETLRSRARDALLEQALSSKIGVGQEPANDLLELDGMTRHCAYVLAAKGIITREDLAEQAVDDLAEIEDLDKALAAKLIMEARKPWFNN